MIFIIYLSAVSNELSGEDNDLLQDYDELKKNNDDEPATFYSHEKAAIVVESRTIDPGQTPYPGPKDTDNV